MCQDTLESPFAVNTKDFKKSSNYQLAYLQECISQWFFSHSEIHNRTASPVFQTNVWLSPFRVDSGHDEVW